MTFLSKYSRNKVLSSTSLFLVLKCKTVRLNGTVAKCETIISQCIAPEHEPLVVYVHAEWPGSAREQDHQVTGSLPSNQDHQAALCLRWVDHGGRRWNQTNQFCSALHASCSSPDLTRRMDETVARYHSFVTHWEISQSRIKIWSQEPGCLMESSINF